MTESWTVRPPLFAVWSGQCGLRACLDLDESVAFALGPSKGKGLALAGRALDWPAGSGQVVADGRGSQLRSMSSSVPMTFPITGKLQLDFSPRDSERTELL